MSQPSDMQSSNPVVTETAPHSPAPASPAVSPTSTKARSWIERRLLVVAILTVLATIGLFLSGYRPEEALWYWSAMFPAFGLISLWQVLTAEKKTDSIARVLLLQAAHWLGPVLAVRILFLPVARGQIAGEAVGMMTLLLLAVTCFLAGVHFTPSFLWVSALLALGVIVGTAIQTYLWVLVVVTLVGVGAAVWSLMRLRKAG